MPANSAPAVRAPQGGQPEGRTTGGAGTGLVGVAADYRCELPEGIVQHLHGGG
ncbi:MAG: hypothetical protein M3Y77_14840 [Actinomycetota bacterium]|nr:hypothetical protein [Actinomycetota bacterium]